jgi:5-methylcytosine-specific restriction enzyme A
MAVTKGHGNPNWTREEVILALDLYHSVEGSMPGPADERVIKLSNELRSLPYHREASKQESFRNPAGISFKLQNIRQVATGKGLPNTARMDSEVWKEFGTNRETAARTAARIRKGLEIAKTDEPHDEDFEFAEGRAVTEAHKRIERNRGVRKKLLKSRRAKGTLHCDICGRDGKEFDEQIRDAMLEAHHTVPLAESGEIKTKLSDMSLLCAICHRLIHRLMSKRKAWVSLVEARDEFG